MQTIKDRNDHFQPVDISTRKVIWIARRRQIAPVNKLNANTRRFNIEVKHRFHLKLER